jgi:hypothetical protein
MTRKIKLLRQGYGGLPYPEGSVIEVADDEGTFIVQSGSAIWADPEAEVTPTPQPPPANPAARAAAEAAAKAEAIKKAEAEHKAKQEEAAKQHKK